MKALEQAQVLEPLGEGRLGVLPFAPFHTTSMNQLVVGCFVMASLLGNI